VKALKETRLNVPCKINSNREGVKNIDKNGIDNSKNIYKNGPCISDLS
jgi:hypothetical protein